MQIFILAMPFIALYMALSPRTGSDMAVMGSVLFAIAMLLALLFTLVKWQRKREPQWRSALVACIIVSFFVGSPYVVRIPGVARQVTERISSSSRSSCESEDDLKMELALRHDREMRRDREMEFAVRHDRAKRTAAID